MGKNTEELKRYIPTAEAIAQTLGRHCEATLYDLSSPESSVIYTVNSHVTGSAVGQPFSPSLTQMLLSPKRKEDVVANYRTQTEDKRTIKTTTVLLRDREGEAIGALCIRVDIESVIGFKDFLEEFVRTEQEALVGESIREKDHGKDKEVGSVWEIVDQMIAQLILGRNVDEIDKNGKLQIVQTMELKGLFLIKGAMEKVAAELKISKVTLYSYLDEIRKQSKVE
jgi:predicted transcriptional regulator YheO